MAASSQIGSLREPDPIQYYHYPDRNYAKRKKPLDLFYWNLKCLGIPQPFCTPRSSNRDSISPEFPLKAVVVDLESHNIPTTMQLESVYLLVF
ncbi:unnamed protein product [Citrullus colocynthis]|uniref:Uncharacterized protein n=1 Tax=Citrullus colocynthis TaxID=252529 RepID=A0ABP0Z3K0_9ROSI